jgi:pyruvate/2-oxoglutarate dehydrogenase complex dihydrolipoamide acyltransferase (E2) component
MKNSKIITAPITDSNTLEIKIVKILFENGDFVNKNSIIFEVETSKTVIEITSDHDGYIKTSHSVGDIIDIKNVLAHISNDKPELKKKSENNELIVSKKASDLISKHKIDIKNLNLKKKVIKESDILKYLNKSDNKSNFNRNLFQEKVSEVVTESKKNIPHAYMSCDIKFNKNEFSKLNCEFLDLIIYFTYKNINLKNYNLFPEDKNEIANITVSKEDNLFMLKITNINQFGIMEIKEKRDSIILDLYRKGYDFQNNIPFGAISFSSLENTSINIQVPIIYPDTLMIIGLGGIIDLDSNLSKISITVSYDHRLINGHQIANFMTKLMSDISKKC